MLSMVTLRNLLRLAGMALSYKSICVNGFIALVYDLVTIRVHIIEYTNTALFMRNLRRKDLNSIDVKIRIVRTTGSNLFEGRRSICSTLVRGEGLQANAWILNSCRLFSTIPTKNLDVGVLNTSLIKSVRACKNKDDRYGNLIQIISSIDSLILAYLIIKKNLGNMMKEIDNKTLDKINLNFFSKISENILNGSFKFLPVRKVEISKGKSKLKPLSISSPCQKIVLKAMEMVFSLIFEEFFLDCNHGFRPNRSCHSALERLQLNVGNVSAFDWVIEGDIKSCFDNIPHNIIIKGINRKIDCPATTNLVKKLLSAGYVLDNGKKKVSKIKNQ